MISQTQGTAKEDGGDFDKRSRETNEPWSQLKISARSANCREQMRNWIEAPTLYYFLPPLWGLDIIF